MKKAKVLFVCEAVSLAHVARPSVLAGALDAEKFDIHFASNGQFALCHADQLLSLHRICSIGSHEFLRRLGSGRPLYSYAELAAYVTEDLALLDAVRPDLIVSDFRLSMGVSARLARIPLLTICNAHWSPYLTHPRMCAPDLALARAVGYRVLDLIFRMVWPFASRLHVGAANRLRADHGLARYRSLNEFYCDGDVAMYADCPEMAGLGKLPASQVFIGPITWSPSLSVPHWWSEVEQCKAPLVYISLGSTGNIDLLPRIVDACRLEKLCCLVSTAGRSSEIRTSAPYVYAEAFLPGTQAAALSSLVICNGGSATAYQALLAGRPVLGICSNLDQVMTMQSIAAANAGEFLRPTEATLQRLRSSIRRLRTSVSYANSARTLQASLLALDPRERFLAIVEAQLTERPTSGP